MLDLGFEGSPPAAVQMPLPSPTFAPPESKPFRAEVDLAGLRVERVLDFGHVYLALSLWRGPGTHTVLPALLPPGAEELLFPNESGAACAFEMQELAGPREWARHAHGAYLRRTNHTEMDDAFRISKSDLYLRPVHRQKPVRVDAHFLGCLLSPLLWRTLEHRMRCRGLGTCARQVIEEVATVRRVEWGGQSVLWDPWAKALCRDQFQRGKAHLEMFRALAFQWIGVLWKCWMTRTPHDGCRHLAAMTRRDPSAA